MKDLAVRCDNAGTLLASVLQGIEAKIGQIRRLRMIIYSNDSAHIMMMLYSTKSKKSMYS